MKKSIYLTVCLIFLCGMGVFANSAPSYWKAYPYSDILAVAKDTPIIVDREHLTFDFTKTHSTGGHGSPAATVLAEYQMTNPTDGVLSVQMAFPFAARLSSLSAADISIMADGTAVPFEIFIDPQRINGSASPDESFSFHYGSIGTITNQELILQGFSLDSDAKRYSLTVSAKEEDNLYLEVSYTADADQTLLIGKDFQAISFSPETGNQLQCRIRVHAKPEILILGKEPELSLEVLTEDGKKADKSLYRLDVISGLTDPKAYLIEAIRQELTAETSAAISDIQLLNPCLHEIMRENRSAGCAMISDVVSAVSDNRIFTLVYQVEFPPRTTKSVSVSYLAEGTMDRRETVSPKYSFTYLLSPAKNWAGFGGLDLEIITPRKAPYIIESSLPLSVSGVNRYSAQFDSLPASELSFTLYEKEQVTWIDKTERAVSKSSYLLFFLWPVLLLVLAIAAVFAARAAIRKVRRVRGSREEK